MGLINELDLASVARCPEDLALQSAMYEACEHALMPIIEREEARLIAAAKTLEQEFRTKKKSLHEFLVKAHGSDGGRRPAGMYSKVQLFAKHRRGTLQIYWQDVHQTRGSGTPAYVYLRKTTASGYDIKALQARAAYAAELVAEYEKRAQVIRGLWKDLMDIKRRCHHALMRLPKDVAKHTTKPEWSEARPSGSQTGFG